MKTKLFAAILGIASLVGSTNLAFANQIPAGYVLVPADLFFGENTEIATTTVAPAAAISTAKSSVRVNDEIGYVGEKYSLATVTLRDDANRPVSNTAVNLISSRATDSVSAISSTTNSNGEIVFRITATEEGVSGLTAVVGGQTILERPRIVFLSPAGGVGGNLLRAEIIAEEDGSVIPGTETPAEFLNQVVVGFPNSVSSNTPTDITITIEDSDGNPVDDFVGTISFKTSDALAILPAEYTFVELDRGTHTFANAITFATTGEQTISVSGGANVGSKEVSVNVVGDGGSTIGLETPLITSPADGALLNESVSVAGIGPANSNLVIFVDGQFFENVDSDTAGEFLEEIFLSDGEHEITVGVLRNDGTIGAVSEAVTITLDQVAPVVKNISLDPGNQITAGESVKVEISSESKLENVIFRVGEISLELDEAVDLGIYTGEFIAPAEGTYFSEVELEDAAGNIGEYPEATTILVVPAITIESVATTPHDGRVDLEWDAPANSSKIANYEIFYGTTAEALDKKFATSDNSTAWYVDNLNSDTQYFFQIVSLSILGKQNGGSEIVSATPIAEVSPIAVQSCNSRIILKWESDNSAIANFWLEYGVESENYVENRMLPDGASRTEWEVRDLVNGTEYFFALRGVNDFGETVAIFDEVSATPKSGAVCSSSDPIQLFQRKDADGNTILFWNAVSGATSYRVHAGTAPNIYDLPTVEVEGTAFQPLGLAAETDYYFAVSAVFSGVHQAATLSNITKVEVGPAEILLIALLAGLGGAFWLRRIKKAGRQF